MGAYWNKDNRGLDPKRKKRKRKKGQVDRHANRQWEDYNIETEALKTMIKLKLFKSNEFRYLY